MEDIAPQLLKEIEDVFKTKVKKESYISKFLLKVQKGNVNFEDMQLYSKKLGELLGNTFVDVLKEDVLPDGKLYWNIAERTILPMLNNNYDLVIKASVEVQKIIDVKDGIGLKAIVPKRPDERIKGILDNVTVDGIPFVETQRRMKEPVTNLTESFFDDFVKQNADFRYKAGLFPQIVRVVKGTKPCKWCKSLAGIYNYEEVKDTGNDVFRRHENCHCQVTYRTNKIRQDVHSKTISENVTQSSINKVLFKNAESIEEAQEYAKQFVKGGFNVTGKTINYKGLSLETANEINRTLTEIFENTKIEKFNSIEVFGKTNKKLWMKHSDAPMCTSNFGNLLINKELCKNAKTIQKYIEDGDEAFEYVIKNIDRLNGRQLELAKTYKEAGKSLVGKSFADMIIHETGHQLSYMSEYNSLFSKLKSSNWKDYARKLSGYANHSFGEYIAESWNGYVINERDNLQRELVEIFDKVMKNEH